MKRLFISLMAVAAISLCGACQSNGAKAETAPNVSPKAASTGAVTADNATSASAADDGVNASLPTVYDFSAKWCGPCRVFAPTWSKVAKEYAAKANFIKVDVDENPQMAQYYGIRSIPTVVVVDKENVVLGGRMGLMDEEEFKAFLKATLDF
ncbi:MAG: thioredoxin domain-containing protein [Candidatus Amulumruptor caecigallinarius]|nr:thioredoxin domain-containing protein [Candidatus Amulumruptor caecigallinarius]MCM1396895.1 thioredoxin domain-containing protein [Candidatus Amulumruptor caecigallinarius]MCM1454161.1 thioredoxin domain-containing protein [bacterium]